MKLHNIKLKNEAVSIGAYFLHKYEQSYKFFFNGYFIIVNFGTKTLDISLLQAQNNKISILTEENLTGNAEISFYQSIVNKALQLQYNIKLRDDDEIYLSLLAEFEKQKQNYSYEIKKAINKYRFGLDKQIFKIKNRQYELKISPSLLIDTFNELFEKDINILLKSIQNNFVDYGIDCRNDKNFKIIFIGGFSNFVLSQAIVKNFFESKTDSDKRFIKFSKENIDFIISKGTSFLIKNIIIEEKESIHPFDIGVVFDKKDKDGLTIQFYETVFKKGDLIKNHNIKYLKNYLTTRVAPTLFFGNSQNIITQPLECKACFPGKKTENNIWRIGFSIEKNELYYLHIEHIKTGKSTKLLFSYLISRFKNSRLTYKIDYFNELEKNIRILKGILIEFESSNNHELLLNRFNVTIDLIFNLLIREISKKNNRLIHDKILKIDNIKFVLKTFRYEKLYKLKNYITTHPAQMLIENGKKDKFIDTMRNIIKFINKIKKELM